MNLVFVYVRSLTLNRSFACLHSHFAFSFQSFNRLSLSLMLCSMYHLQITTLTPGPP